MIRQHQFSKVELVSITTPEKSLEEHERMLACAEAVLKALRSNTAYLQSEVARRVNTKYAARLKFLLDESFDEGSHIEALLRSPVVARDLDEDR